MQCSNEPALTMPEGFAAIFEFQLAYWERGGRRGQPADVLSDMQVIHADGRPADPAIWGDRLDAVRKARPKSAHCG